MWLGVLLYGPPGTGKTLLARACAAQTKSTFLKLAGPQLVQMFIGDGAKLVRDAFSLAKEKKPAIIFIDELDAIGKSSRLLECLVTPVVHHSYCECTCISSGTKRFDSEKAGDREVQRTMLELLNQLDGFHPSAEIKVLPHSVLYTLISLICFTICDNVLSCVHRWLLLQTGSIYWIQHCCVQGDSIVK